MVRLTFLILATVILFQIASELHSIREDVKEMKLQATSIFALHSYILPINTTRLGNNCMRCHR